MQGKEGADAWLRKLGAVGREHGAELLTGRKSTWFGILILIILLRDMIGISEVEMEWLIKGSAAFFVGQGMSDFGKGRAEVAANAPTEPAATATLDPTPS